MEKEGIRECSKIEKGIKEVKKGDTEEKIGKKNQGREEGKGKETKDREG